MTTAERLQREGERRGERRGERKGRTQMLLRQLRTRFDELDPELEQRVRTASIADLDRWAERVLNANTLDDVFDDD